MLTFLETERLLLRQFTPDDAELLVELDSDPRVMRYITGGIPTSRGEIESDFLPAFLDYYQRFPGYGFWAALEKTTGEFLGWFHFRPGPDNPQDQPELGYRLRREAWEIGTRRRHRGRRSPRGSPSSGSTACSLDHGSQHGLPKGDGEIRDAARAGLRRRLAGARSGRRARRRRVRDHPR